MFQFPTYIAAVLIAVAILFATTRGAHAQFVYSPWVERFSSYLETAWSGGRDILINGTNKYLNFGSISGSTGYGFRDAAGQMQFKHSGGSWADIGSGTGTSTGTVTSVAMTVPTGLTVSGSPITVSGTLALSLTSGYAIPLTASTTQWATAYGWGDHASQGYVTDLSSFDTGDLSEGSNLYFTNDRADARITAQKGEANGLATLDGGGKIPVSQLPNSIMQYQGTWDADTNTPTLTDGAGSTGDVYRVTTGGSQDLGSGSITFVTGDYAIYNGSTWEKADTTDAVSSVNGFTGDVQLALDDLDSCTDCLTTTEIADSYVLNTGDTMTGNLTISSGGLTTTGTVLHNSLTANRLVVTNGSKHLTSSISSSNLAASITNETGTGNAVFSASPTFTGTVNTAALTASGNLTLSGSAANIALGSNWLSGDGDDEGVFVSSNGNVGIGDTSPAALLTVGSGDAFQVNSSGAIAAATGITSSGQLAMSGTGTSTIAGDLVVGASSATLPNARLTVDGDATNSFIRIDNPGGSGNRFGYLFNYGNIGSITADPSTSQGLRITRLSTGPITWGVNNNNAFAAQTFTPQMTLDTDGDLGIGTTNPGSKLHVYSGASGATPIATADDFVVEGSVSSGISILTPNNANGNIFFGDPEGNLQGGFLYSHAADSLSVRTNNATQMTILSSGDVGIGETNPQRPLHISNNGSLHQLTLEDDDLAASGRYWLLGNQNGSFSIDQTTNASGLLTSLVNRLTVNTSGNVGIGETAPDDLLHIKQAGEATLKLENTGNGNVSSILFSRETSVGTDRGGAAIRMLSDTSGTSGNLEFLTGSNILESSSGVTRMVIDTSGNVGIGTTTPIRPLHVGSQSFPQIVIDDLDGDGTTATSRYELWGTGSRFGFFGKASSLNGNITISNENNANIDFFTNGTRQVTIDNVGNVGIGVAAPTHLLQLEKNNVSGDVGIAIGNTGAGTSNTSGTASLYFNHANFSTHSGGKIVSGRENDYASGANSDSYMAFYTALNNTDTEQMRINSDGNVGIGTTTPQYTLDVYDPTANSVALFESGDASVNILFRDNSTTNNSYIGALDNDLYLGHATGGLQAVLTAGGNFGVGTTSPAKKFSVDGESYLDGLIHFGNGMCMGEDTGTTTPNVTIQDCGDF